MTGLRRRSGGDEADDPDGRSTGDGGRERGVRSGERERSARKSDDRGQSEVLSVVLLLAITITGTGLIVAYGSSALDDSKQASELDSAEHAMTQLDSKVSLVGIGASRTQTVSLGFDATTRVENDSGWMRVMVNPVEGSPTTILNQTLGAVVYENGDTTIAYQGGGVWRRADNGTTMVSPPEVHYRETTLTLPLVVVNGRGPLGGKATIRQNGTGEAKFPLAADGRRNPLTEAEVNLTVHSRYYRAWGRFFEQRTGGEATFDHENRTVTLKLVTPPDVPKVDQGVASTSSQKLTIKGGGGEVTFTNSYNSSIGPYSESKNQSGTVKTVGGVTMSGDAEIRGDLVSGGGEVELGSSNSKVGGNISYGGSVDLHQKAEVDGWIASNGSVSEIDPVGGMVTARNATIRDDEDAEQVDLSACSSTCELTAGSYYTDRIDLDDGEKLVLDLSGGSIALAVSGPVSVDGGEIRVKNPDGGRANVYMDASRVSVVSHASVTVEDDESGSLRIYGPPGVEAKFSDSTFVGMLYAPNSESQHGEITVKTHAEVYGALVGGRTILRSGGVVHYDSALSESTTLPADYETAPHVTYMHISVSRVNVTSV